MQEQGRFNYVTPTSYLELLSIFSAIFGLKKNELLQQKKRTKTGLDKLLSTEREVTKLRAELEEMQPLLAEAVEETTQTMETIAVDSKVGFWKVLVGEGRTIRDRAILSVKFWVRVIWSSCQFIMNFMSENYFKNIETLTCIDQIFIRLRL